MFLKNAKPWISSKLGFGANLSTYKPVNAYDQKELPYYDSMYGYDITGLMKNISSGTYAKRDGSNMVGVLFGSGSVPPTVDDTRLSGSPITGLSTSNVTYTQTTGCEEDTKKSYVTTVYSISNTTNKEITIGEVALVYQLSGRDETVSSGSCAYGVLLERTAFDTPITIPAGSIGQITYTIWFESPADIV